MEAQLQEQQSRDKEIKAVRLNEMSLTFLRYISRKYFVEQIVTTHRQLQDCPKKSWRSTKAFSPSLTGIYLFSSSLTYSWAATCGHPQLVKFSLSWVVVGHTKVTLPLMTDADSSWKSLNTPFHCQNDKSLIVIH